LRHPRGILLYIMPLQLTIGPLALFAFVASITPGPNNLMLMRSGATFGVRRSLSHVFGVQSGFLLLIGLAHAGIAGLLLALPGILTVLRVACFAYLLWLAWLIYKDGRVQAGRPVAATAASSGSRPMNFLEGVAFQFINPKGWMMAVTVASAFYGGVAPGHVDLLAAALVSVAIGGPCMLTWTLWGASLDHLLKQPRARSAFSYVMSLLVVATAFWMLR
jgi:threonine/homoserine/homoserine lactone efflux protein